MGRHINGITYTEDSTNITTYYIRLPCPIYLRTNIVLYLAEKYMEIYCRKITKNAI